MQIAFSIEYRNRARGQGLLIVQGIETKYFSMEIVTYFDLSIHLHYRNAIVTLTRIAPQRLKSPTKI